MSAQLEIACFNFESALVAKKAGADRIELCENYFLGGITPSFALFEKLRKSISIDIYVMLRPRGGDFDYTEMEFFQMKQDLLHFKNAGANGFVFGILNPNQQVDVIRNKELIKLAMPLPCTFHRAFDEIEDDLAALNLLIECGFTNILSAGKAKNAIEGVLNLKKMIDFVNQKINVIAGGGIRSHNIHVLTEKLNLGFYHTSALKELTEMIDYTEVLAIKDKLKN